MAPEAGAGHPSPALSLHPQQQANTTLTSGCDPESQPGTPFPRSRWEACVPLKGLVMKRGAQQGLAAEQLALTVHRKPELGSRAGGCSLLPRPHFRPTGSSHCVALAEKKKSFHESNFYTSLLRLSTSVSKHANPFVLLSLLGFHHRFICQGPEPRTGREAADPEQWGRARMTQDAAAPQRPCPGRRC